MPRMNILNAVEREAFDSLALNQHPRIVGVRKYRYHSPIVSAIWSSFTVITRGSSTASTSQRRCGRLSIAARNTALTGWSRASHLSVSGLYFVGDTRRPSPTREKGDCGSQASHRSTIL